MEVKDEWYEAQFGGHRNTRLQQRQPLTLIFLFTFQSSNLPQCCFNATSSI